MSRVRYGVLSLVPEEGGVYGIFRNGQLVYVGMAINLRKRMKEHYANNAYKDFADEVGFINSSDTTARRDMEKWLIGKYRPFTNRACNPDYRAMHPANRDLEWGKRVNAIIKSYRTDRACSQSILDALGVQKITKVSYRKVVQA